MRFVIIALLFFTMNVAYSVKSQDEYDKLFPCKEVFDIPCSPKSSSKHVKFSADTLNPKSALILNPSQSIAPVKGEHSRPFIIQDDTDWRDWIFLIGMGTFIICSKAMCYYDMIAPKTCNSLFD